ncbi:MAG: hypothetical protein AAFV19_17155 [Pseudomonadota bacterium]
MADLIVTNSETTLVCRTAGDPAAPLLLFLHGFPEYSGAWAGMFARLSDRF